MAFLSHLVIYCSVVIGKKQVFTIIYLYKITDVMRQTTSDFSHVKKID